MAVEFEATDCEGKTWFEVRAYPSSGSISVSSATSRTEARRGERLTTSKLVVDLAGIARLNNILPP